MKLKSRKADILIVDDKPENLRFLSDVLVKDGYQVRSALNGELALVAAKADVPDLILLDVKIPGMTAYEVCRRLKDETDTSNVPIIFISALGEIENKVKALSVGGVDYITKPFKIEDVLARVGTHLAVRNLQRQLESANRELAQQVMELNAKNEELDAFAHTVSHDLKNPLTSLMLRIDLLNDTWDTMPDERIEQELIKMDGNVEKMNTIIDELLLLASVRKEDVKPSVIDTGLLIYEVQNRQESLITRHKAEITTPVPDQWPPVLGHPRWVEEVWANYISNAIKYGGRPPVIKIDFFDLQTEVKFTITDNGKGITDKQQALLFTPFERLEQAHARGSGLGLSVVQRIVEKLGGQVGVESKPGRGSTFWFTLPKNE